MFIHPQESLENHEADILMPEEGATGLRGQEDITFPPGEGLVSEGGSIRDGLGGWRRFSGQGRR